MKLRKTKFSEGYIHRLMDILGVKARIRRKRGKKLKIVKKILDLQYSQIKI